MIQTNLEIINLLPVSVIPVLPEKILTERETAFPTKNVFISDSRYTIKLAENQTEVFELLKLRYQIFKVELGKQTDDYLEIESDEFDSTSRHLIAVENESGRVIGGYRLRTVETNINGLGFYSAEEFCLENLPNEILDQAVEIGRACIDQSHRNSKVLFLLWKGLAQYLLLMKKRYLFGCCSLFSNDFSDGLNAYHQLKRGGFMHENLTVSPVMPELFETENSFKTKKSTEIELPKLFTTYLRIGAKVCSQPIIDREFCTIDFFVIFDSLNMNEKYRKMFFP